MAAVNELELKEMLHRFHLLMQYSDHKNIVFTFSVKNGVPLVIMPTYPKSYFRTVMSHEWGAVKEVKGIFQLAGVYVCLTNTKVKQCIFIDSCEILHSKLG
jgi:hypothetical protein